MPKTDSLREESLPGPVVSLMKRLGEDLRIARKRRKISLRDMASRVGVSVNTYRKLEEGRPTATAVFLTALWVLGLERKMDGVIAPEADSRALEKEIEKVSARGRKTRRRDEDDLDF